MSTLPDLRNVKDSSSLSVNNQSKAQLRHLQNKINGNIRVSSFKDRLKRFDKTNNLAYSMQAKNNYFVTVNDKAEKPYLTTESANRKSNETKEIDSLEVLIKVGSSLEQN